MPRYFVSLDTWSKTPLMFEDGEINYLGKAITTKLEKKGSVSSIQGRRDDKGYSSPAKKRTNMNVSEGRKGKRKTSEVTDPAEVYQGDEPIVRGEVLTYVDSSLHEEIGLADQRKGFDASVAESANKHTNKSGRVGFVPVLVADPMPKKDKQ
ncbi:hypothetical protein QYF36_020909 [Acer negundo]|nr:hypothetical protein QYF36_020909 [Acer negundo]